MAVFRQPQSDGSGIEFSAFNSLSSVHTGALVGLVGVGAGGGRVEVGGAVRALGGFWGSGGPTLVPPGPSGGTSPPSGCCRVVLCVCWGAVSSEPGPAWGPGRRVEFNPVV